MVSAPPLSRSMETAAGPLGLSYTSAFFLALFIAVSGWFAMWGLGYTGYNHSAVFLLATVFGLFMAFNIGGNDVANSFGTSVGAGTLTIKQALIIAAVFEVSGAVIAGGEVTDTIRSGIVDLSGVAVEPMQFVSIMMSALLAAALWLLFASRKGWPVSTTHSIVGGIVGSSITLGFLLNGSDQAFELVQWDQIGTIAMSWILSPVLGGIVSYTLFFQIKAHVLSYNERAKEQLLRIRQQRRQLNEDHKTNFERLNEVQKISYTDAMVRDAQIFSEADCKPEDLESDYYRQLYAIHQQKETVAAHQALQNWVPLIAAGGAAIISSMLLFKGLKHMHLGFSVLQNYLIMGMVAAVAWMATFVFVKTVKGSGSLDRSTFLLFSWMQVFTASGFAFSHGANDIANAIGPFAAVLDVLKTGNVNSEAAVPPLAMLAFGVALITGLWFIGREVIRTVGHGLTSMHPASGFAAELSAAAVVMLASTFGIPVSSTHILIGAVLGIGLVNNQTNWGLMKPIAMAWVITLPAAASLAAASFLVLNQIL